MRKQERNKARALAEKRDAERKKRRDSKKSQKGGKRKG